jgi:hypothetical protein
MAFIIKKTSLRTMMLCGNPLPWVSKLKHLGMIITNKVDGCQEDMRVKNARYIDKNTQLIQEFYFTQYLQLTFYWLPVLEYLSRVPSGRRGRGVEASR